MENIELATLTRTPVFSEICAYSKPAEYSPISFSYGIWGVGMCGQKRFTGNQRSTVFSHCRIFCTSSSKSMLYRMHVSCIYHLYIHIPIDQLLCRAQTKQEAWRQSSVPQSMWPALHTQQKYHISAAQEAFRSNLHLSASQSKNSWRSHEMAWP